MVNADADHAEDFIRAAQIRRAELLTVGERGNGLKLLTRQAKADGQYLSVQFLGKTFEVALPLEGSFQASNALVAAGLAIGLGEEAGRVFAALGKLRGAPVD